MKPVELTLCDNREVSRRTFLWISSLWMLELLPGCSLATKTTGGPPTGTFENLGTPVHIGLLHGARVGPDDRGRQRWVYFAFAQAQGSPPFLLVVDPDNSNTRQFFPPKDCEVDGFKSLYPGTDGSVYIGGYSPGRLLRFDPRHAERGLEDLGVLPGANMVWWMLEAADGRLYMTTSTSKVGARLFSWAPQPSAIQDHGQLSMENSYATYLLASEDRWTLYAVVAPEKHDVIAYDVRTGKRWGLLKDDERGIGFISIQRGEDDFLYAGLLNKRVVLAQENKVDSGSPWHDLKDGRRIIASDDSLTIVSAGSKKRILHLSYEAGAEIFTLHPGPDSKVYTATQSPLRLCCFDPQTGKLTALGNPFATANGSVGGMVNWQGKIVLAAYPNCDLSMYDPAQPWNKGPTPQHNPWTWGTPKGEGYTRPVGGMSGGSDGMIYLASTAGYGVTGGAVVCLNPQTGKTVNNIREPFVTRPAYSLAADPEQPAIYIGCTGVEPSVDGSVKGAHVVAWDTQRHRLLWDVVPIAEARYISSLNYAAGKICGTTLHDYATQHFFVLDPYTGKTLYIAKTPVAGVVYCNLRPGPDGWLYGLTHVQRTLFRIHPETCVVEEIAKPLQASSYALAVTQDGLYFGAGPRLMRFRFDEPLTPRA